MSTGFDAKITKYNAKLDTSYQIAKKAVEKPSTKNLEEAAKEREHVKKIFNKALDLESKAGENLEEQSQVKRLCSRSRLLEVVYQNIGEEADKLKSSLRAYKLFEKSLKKDLAVTWDQLSPICDAFKDVSTAARRKEAFDGFASLPLKVQEKIIAKKPDAKGREVALSILSYYRSSVIESVIHFAEVKDRETIKALIEALPKKIQDGIKLEITNLKETDGAAKKALKEDKWKPWVVAKAAKATVPNLMQKFRRQMKRCKPFLIN